MAAAEVEKPRSFFVIIRQKWLVEEKFQCISQFFKLCRVPDAGQNLLPDWPNDG
jgi:hypothetical protein